MRTSLSLLMVVGTALVSFTACGTQTNGTCEETLSCGGTDGGGDVVIGTDGGGDVVQPPAGCDPAAEPKDAPKCVVNDFGVFVDATNGSETNAGTKESPVKSIGAALGKLGAKSRVYVCEGTYKEHMKLTSAVSLYGGFSCGAWSYSGTKAKVAPADVGYALEIANVSGAVTVSDVEIVVVAGTAATPSSIAAFVVSSPMVTLRRATAQAGAGLKGNDGADAATGTITAVSSGTVDYGGNSGDLTTGGKSKICTCSTGGTSTGGNGGDTGGVAPDGVAGAQAQVPSTSSGAGQARAACESAGVAAQPGSDAPAAAGASAPNLGVLDATGWHPGDGSAGMKGAPAQGGGGGGSYSKGAPAANGGGGGGACGGCGGGAGGGGKAGGSSIGLVAFESAVKLEACMLSATNAGQGGTGKAGADGAPGGVHGNGGNNACVGGAGGTGGRGGAGAGGSGGVSAGILFKAGKPNADTATTFSNGAKGLKGAGGNAGMNDGVDGEAGNTIEVQ
jgi:hypothetical protein